MKSRNLYIGQKTIYELNNLFPTVEEYEKLPLFLLILLQDYIDLRERKTNHLEEMDDLQLADLVLQRTKYGNNAFGRAGGLIMYHVFALFVEELEKKIKGTPKHE